MMLLALAAVSPSESSVNTSSPAHDKHQLLLLAPKPPLSILNSAFKRLLRGLTYFLLFKYTAQKTTHRPTSEIFPLEKLNTHNAFLK